MSIRSRFRSRCQPAGQPSLANDIQLLSVCADHFRVIFLMWLQKFRLLSPVMSPVPHLLSWMPPNEKGSRGTGTPMLTPIMPARAWSATCWAMAPFVVKTEAALPYGFAFSTAIAAVRLGTRRI